MIFNHRETKRAVLWITAYDPSWTNQNDPNLRRIRSFEDLPFTEDVAHIYKQMHIDPIMWELNGRRGFYFYLRAFFMDDWCHAKDKGAGILELRKLAKAGKKAEKDFWFLLMPSGFPKKEQNNIFLHRR